MKKKILVTSALPYANGPLHVGHLVEYIQTDIFVRFLKLTGEDAIYCCADDTHGAPIEIKAKQLGITPEELIKRFYKEHIKDFKDFLIDFDSYYSTNSPENKHFSDLIFNTLNKKGFIYKKIVEITYCEHCKRSLPDRYVKGKCPKCNAEEQYGDVCEKCNATYSTIELIDPYCTICKNKPIRKKSEHYFFKLSAFSDKLKEWLEQNKSLQPEMINYVRNWIKEGLQDWDISRDGPYFGFKIPNEKDKYYYVWLDAPIGYIASTANYCKKNKLDTEKDYWKNKNTKIIHFIGKDIIYFHFLFWPAMLMGSGFNLPNNIVVHGFLTIKGEKMSKSRGTFLTAKEFLEEYSPEYLRFYYSKVLSKKMSDINLDFDEFKHTINNELVANIGNFCYRVLSFLEKNFDGRINSIEKNEKLINEINDKIKKIKNNYSELNYNEAVKGIMAVSSIGNRYFQDSEPWKLINRDKEKTIKILGLCLNITKNLGIVLKPILPKFSSDLEKQLNLNNLSWKDINFDLENHKIGKIKPLIRKIEDKTKEEFPLNLKVAKIIKVGDHPNADKLYVLKVGLGAEQRQIVAGLKEHYSKEELVGKKIIIVTNLKNAKLRGVESQGMLLAADDKKNCGLLYAEKSELGAVVRAGNLKNSSKEISFDSFSKLNIFLKNGKVVYNNLILGTDGEEVKADKVKKFKDGTRVR